jgi:hypothetical protein
MLRMRPTTPSLLLKPREAKRKRGTRTPLSPPFLALVTTRQLLPLHLSNSRTHLSTRTLQNRTIPLHLLAQTPPATQIRSVRMPPWQTPNFRQPGPLLPPAPTHHVNTDNDSSSMTLVDNPTATAADPPQAAPPQDVRQVLLLQQPFLVILRTLAPPSALPK